MSREDHKAVSPPREGEEGAVAVRRGGRRQEGRRAGPGGCGQLLLHRPGCAEEGAEGPAGARGQVPGRPPVASGRPNPRREAPEVERLGASAHGDPPGTAPRRPLSGPRAPQSAGRA